MAQTTPSPPKAKNAYRQLTYCRIQTTSKGVKAPPQRAKVHMMPCARTRSTGGSQVVKALVRFGKQPASPAPNRNRVTNMDEKFHMTPVSAVNADHHNTIRIRTFRGPIKSPNHPPGISNSA